MFGAGKMMMGIICEHPGARQPHQISMVAASAAMLAVAISEQQDLTLAVTAHLGFGGASIQLTTIRAFPCTDRGSSVLSLGAVLALVGVVRAAGRL